MCWETWAGVPASLNRNPPSFVQLFGGSLVQNDASINPGGGPLFTPQGQVVGINTFGYSYSVLVESLQGLEYGMSTTPGWWTHKDHSTTWKNGYTSAPLSLLPAFSPFAPIEPVGQQALRMDF